MFTIALSIAVLTLMGLLAIKRIPEGQVYTLRRLGKPAGTLTSGTHLVVPLVEHVAHKISMTGYTLAVDEHLESESGASPVLRGRIWWQVLDPERADAVIDRADELLRGQVRRAATKDDHDGADVDSRSRNQRIKESLNRNLHARGLLVTRVELHLAA